MSSPATMDEDNPDSLFEICADYILSNMYECGLAYNCSSEPTMLKPNVFIPDPIGDYLVNRQVKLNRLSDNFMSLFDDHLRTKLRKLYLRHCSVTDRTLRYITRHPLMELDISACQGLTLSGLALLTQCQATLQSLDLSHSDELYDSKLNLHKLTNLRRLSLNGSNITTEYLAVTIPKLEHLVSLDLSRVDIGDLHYITPLKNTLCSLILFDSVYDPDIFEDIIYHMKNLRHLDISQTFNRPILSGDPAGKGILKEIVLNLPKLQSLDLSGTELAERVPENRPAEEVASRRKLTADEKVNNSSIPALLGLRQPLTFLGLFHTGVCSLPIIPAIRVAGSSTQEQILCAMEVYRDRLEFLMQAINALFEHIQALLLEPPQLSVKAVEYILAGLERNPGHQSLLISASAALYYLRKREYQGFHSVRLCRRIILALLDSMTAFPDDRVLQRNCCLTLYNFKKEHLSYYYERVLKNILKLCSNTDHSLQRIAIHFVNGLVSLVSGEQKVLAGKLGVILTMLKVIRNKLRQNQADDPMEVAWSTLWNVTDETPLNCEMFLDDEGMRLFTTCLERFPNSQDLKRNMLGLLGNVAEVKYLRPKLMQEQYMKIFVELLDCPEEGIEISYNAAGILSHVLSDGEKSWTISRPTRQQTMNYMFERMLKWDLTSQRNINYRSFEPLLQLLPYFDIPEAQYWAIWAMANLCTVYPQKYCQLIREEKGVDLIRKVLSTPTKYSQIHDLCSKILQLVAANPEPYEEDNAMIL